MITGRFWRYPPVSTRDHGNHDTGRDGRHAAWQGRLRRVGTDIGASEAGTGTIKVGVLGARGRMGSTVCDAVRDAPGLRVTAEIDLGDDREALTGCDVVVDFTHPGAVMDNLRWCAAHGL